MKNTLHIYCRVSTEIQVEQGHSLEAQKKAGIQRAKALGMGIEVHLEKGKSATNDDLDNRPVLKKILDDCDDGVVKHIFITELDRLTRSPVTMYFIKKILMDNGVMLHTTSQSINLLDEEQEFFSDLTALLSRRENTIRAKRSKRGLLEAVKKGKWIGIIRPYGYKKNETTGALEIDEEEAKSYKLMVQLSLEGNGTNTIAKKLTEKNIPTRCKTVLPNGTKTKNKFTGKLREIRNQDFIWRPGTVYCILTNPIYKGERRYKGQTIDSPAIIDKALWQSVQTQLKKNKHYSQNHTKKHFFLLKGLIRCGRCGSNLYGKIKSDERIYMCSSKRAKSCGLRSVNLDRFNKLVWEVVTDNKLQIECLKKELQSQNADERISVLNQNYKGLETEQVSINKRKENLIILFEKEKITIEEFEARNKAHVKDKEIIEKQLKSVLTELTVLSNKVTQINNLSVDDEIKAQIGAWSDEQKRQFLNQKVKNIEVMWSDLYKNHAISITFEAGFEISKTIFTKGSDQMMVFDDKELITKGIHQSVSNKLVTTPHQKLCDAGF